MIRRLLIVLACVLSVVTARDAFAAESPAVQAAKAARAVLDRNSKANAPAFYLEVGRPRRVVATLAFAAGGSKVLADEWLLFMPQPPDLTGQRTVSFNAVPEATKVAEPTGLRRPLLMWRIQAEGPKRHVVGVSVEYTLDLMSRRLVTLAKDQKPPAAAVELTAGERAAFSAESELLDFAAPAFQDWLAKNDLRPAAAETDVDLARRVFLHLKEKSSFEFAGDATERRASRVCASMKSDCGGLTAVYAAALRANGIPARQLVGRWATSAKKDETLYGKPWQQEHVQCEFYGAGIGWTPVDISVAVDFDKKAGSLEHFGQERGRFIALHVDADVQADVPKLGRRKTRFMQEPAYYFLGRGTLDNDVTRCEWVVQGSRR